MCNHYNEKDIKPYVCMICAKQYLNDYYGKNQIVINCCKKCIGYSVSVNELNCVEWNCLNLYARKKVEEKAKEIIENIAKLEKINWKMKH